MPIKDVSFLIRENRFEIVINTITIIGNAAQAHLEPDANKV